MEPDQNTLESFVDRLLKEKQFQNLEPEVEEQLKKDLITRAHDHVNAALLAELSEEDLKTFEKMIEKNKDGQEAKDFIEGHVQNPEQVIAAALIRFRNLYIGN